jgi:hypothetical protein
MLELSARSHWTVRDACLAIMHPRMYHVRDCHSCDAMQTKAGRVIYFRRSWPGLAWPEFVRALLPSTGDQG